MMRQLFLALATLMAVGCRAPDRPNQETLILISIDGFRPDYLEWYDAPNLSALAREGVSAPDGMLPVFPSKTFPNHYSIVTGLYPSSSGMLSNTMYDEESDSWFRMRDRSAVEDPVWWGGEPIWVTAEKQGRVSATYFWVGSEAPIQGIQPTFWYRFDGSVPGKERVDQALAWLDLPLQERPTFITLYFEDVDSIGHRFGPESQEVEEAVARMDGLIGRLLVGLRERTLLDSVNLMIVSDHGMAEIDPDRVVILEDFLEAGDGLIVDYGPVLTIRPNEGRERAVRSAIEAMPGVNLMSQEDLAGFHYTGHPRIPAVVGLAESGWSLFSTRERWEARKGRAGLGNHGFDPRSQEMGALFIANGPAFREGLQVPAFENIHLYELMSEVLGLSPANNDGNLDVVRGFLN